MTPGNQEPSRKGTAGLVFVGLLLIGFAAGLLTREVAIGVLGGLGAGFLGMAIARGITGHW
jgi:hypothetical protein